MHGTLGVVQLKQEQRVWLVELFLLLFISAMLIAFPDLISAA